MLDGVPSRPAVADLLAAAEKLGDHFAAGAAMRDADRHLPYAEMRDVAASGILGARIPVSHGGPDATFTDVARMLIALGKGDPNIAQAIQPHLCVLEKLRLYATPLQQERYFGEIARGALITNANAERGGKRVGDTNTTLNRDGARYRLNGTKFYTTGSLFTQFFYITVVAEDESRAIVVVPADRAGVSIRDDWDGLGQRTTASGTTILADVAVAPDEVLWLPDHGRRRTHEGATAQLYHAAIDSGIALAALADAVDYGRTRARPVPEAGVDRAADDPYVLHSIGEMATLAYGAVAMVERAGGILDIAATLLLGGDLAEAELIEASVAVAMAKAAANDASLRVSEMLFRVGGASASLRTHNLDRHWRNARTHTLHDPVAYKSRMIGEFYMNDRPPPITSKY